MTDDVTTDFCPLCPHTEEAFTEDGDAGHGEAIERLLKHIQTVHSLSEEHAEKAVYVGLAHELTEPSDGRMFLEHEGVSPEEYEIITGHKLWCTTGFNGECQCGATPAVADGA